MVQRRLFTPLITESDDFIDMPVSSQNLYFHLNMNADDEGFVQPKRVMRSIGANDDDLNVLKAKNFVLVFESAVLVIKHWNMHNSIRKDRLKPTRFDEEKKQLFLKKNGSYTLDRQQGVPLLKTNWQPNDNQMTTKRRPKLSKVKLSKVNKIHTSKSDDVRPLYELFIKLFDKNPSQYKLSPKRRQKIQVRLRDCGSEMITKAIENVANSSFHRGDNDRGWQADLDWIVRSYEQVERLANLDASSKVIEYKMEF